MLLRCIWMIIGALIYTVGLDLFLVPNNIIDGGVVGISLMTAELTGISFSIFVVLINIPFLYIGYRINGQGIHHIYLVFYRLDGHIFILCP